MKIDPVSSTFRKLITSQFLKIPKFQRPYSWGTENVEELWSDLNDFSGDGYFVGSIVMYEDGADAQSVYITDGQQRLTTLVILLCAIRDVADLNNYSGIANGIRNLISREDIDDKKRNALRYEVPNKYFANQIINPSELGDSDPSSAEERTQRNTLLILRSKVASYINGTEDAEEALRVLRNAVLSIEFISLTLNSEDDAYIVFETLNSRGMDLQVSDLLKNHLSKLIDSKAKNKDSITVNDVWNGIRARFEGADSKVPFDAFLFHYWLSSKDPVARKLLFKAFKKEVKASNAKIFLSDVSTASRSYLEVASPQGAGISKQNESIRRSLTALQIFGVAQARPLLLAIMRAHREKNFVKAKQVKTAFELVENFAFQFNAITQSRGGGGISSMYARLARGVSAAETAQTFSNAIGEMRDTFKNRDITQSLFVANFMELAYSNEYPADRKLVRYVLEKFHRHANQKQAFDYEQFSIEHLVPQSSTIDQDTIAAIGNLLFIPNTLNENLDNKSFIKKKPKLVSSGHSLGFIEEWNKAAESNIIKRSEQLAMLAFEKVWKI